MKIYWIPILMFGFLGLQAQDYALRYQAPVFDSLSIQKDVAYAKYRPSFWKGLFAGKDSVELTFDFYEGAADPLEKRALVILAHGGAFVKGSNKDKHITILAEYLAKKGFAVASISYRLREYPSLLKLGYLGVQDARAAIRYFRMNAKSYRIHPDHIYFGGVSAGAVMALHTAYLDDGEPMAGRNFKSSLGCLDCFGDYQDTPSNVSGIISIAGALIDTTCIQQDDLVPSIHFHGTNDLILDYEKDLPIKPLMNSFNGLVDRIIEEVDDENEGEDGKRDIVKSYLEKAKMPEVYGSKAIVERLSEKNIPYELFTFSEDDHYLMVDKKEKPQASFYNIEKKSSQFLYRLMAPDSIEATFDGSLKPLAHHTNIYQAPAGQAAYHWEVKGGHITKNEGQQVQVQWDSIGQQSIAYRVGNELGAYGPVYSFPVFVQKENNLQYLSRQSRNFWPWILALTLLMGLGWWKFGKKSGIGQNK